MLTLVIVVLATLVGGSLQQPGIINLNLGGGGDAVAPQTPYVKPAFCHDLDCPKYTVMETNDQFEKRRYEPSVWVATSLYTFNYTKAQNDLMFYKLFHYISGNNSANQKIAMTAPVVTEIVHGPGPDCESNFTMHFMVPFDLQANPPAPTESSVFIKRVPEMTVYVKSYSGFSNDALKRQNLEEEVNSLDSMNRKYSESVFLTASYDGPFAFVRHNEIWLVAM
ncbi:heme-binding protein 2-like [Mya arenaria]|uniref:heme-binding protein 2-like n=1 Tax=Mya arenaria TaxID=6604 RepID=UPI0022E0F50F|nr:heme-binding protein 2-like [Mya arenaria]